MSVFLKDPRHMLIALFPCAAIRHTPSYGIRLLTIGLVLVLVVVKLYPPSCSTPAMSLSLAMSL